MKTITKLVLFASLVADITFGHPYSAQLIPFRVVEERVVDQFENPSVPATFFVQPEGQRSVQPQACTARSSQPASLSLADNMASALPIAEFKFLPRVIHSDADARLPVIETIQTANPLMVAPSGDLAESPLMRSVRSALEAMAPLLFSERKVSVQREIPVDLPAEATNPPIYSDTLAKKVQSQNSQTEHPSSEGYGMTYDLRVQSFKSFPEQLGRVDIEEPKENELDDQQIEIVNNLKELTMGQWTLLMEQQDMESMMEREFQNQESYTKEIKRLLNLLRKSMESKDKVPHSESVPSPTTSIPEVAETSQSEGPTITTAEPNTTSTVPTTTENQSNERTMK